MSLSIKLIICQHENFPFSKVSPNCQFNFGHDKIKFEIGNNIKNSDKVGKLFVVKEFSDLTITKTTLKKTIFMC